MLSFRQWKYNDPDFIDKISTIVRIIYEKYKLIPLFIPMQFPNDQIISEDIIQKSKVKCHILRKEYSVKELLGIINRTEFVIAMRLHTLIYSVSVNIPVIGIVYDPKIKSFMEYINQDKYMDTNNINVETIIKMVGEIETNREQIKDDLETEIKKLKKLCYDDPKLAVSLIE